MKGTEFAELVAFMAVSQERSFRRAARRLGMSPSALSHTIRSLEERLGARLLNRTTRSVAPTEAGQVLFDRLRPAIADMEGAVRDVGACQMQPRGVVRVNLPRIAACLVVTPILADFLRGYPEVRLDLVIDDAVTDVVAKGFDAGIRSGERVAQDMVAVRLTPDLRMAVVGSPAYFRHRSLPQVPRDIRDHACITYRWHETGALYRWTFDSPGGSIDVDVDSVITANDTDLLLAAALQGAGLAFLPESFVAAHIARGELIRVLDACCKPFSGFYLYYPNRTHLPAALRAFIDFIKLPGSSLAARP
ncbi:HTH-type transcriptional regulator PgrR [Rhodovastum atsumiense]|uniref:LysR family transcriptional regulator n=1 Tax=Rhodovastum atsumiense TaxID=504468 RepID=A0A5M6IUV2_9PROT|nr:LysR family transcriptional regulator [Rhodovastum atsumiense]KAA5611729.1 LysR family transcriptional regulator [Rhodovastum atsumiense]CAH2604308.1 HTH-type transcriptional regulator PgrR [Rhodovastum atsumiense]